MGEIEVGEYVRTNKGNIGQVIGIFNGHCQAKYHIQFQGRVKVKRQYLSTHTIINHSKQLIDLIEVGDIVNKGYIYEIGNAENGDRWIHSLNGLLLYEEDVKTILTKESYMDSCYKVGGEDE